MTATETLPATAHADPLERVVHLVCGCQFDARLLPHDPDGPIALCGVRCDGEHVRGPDPRGVCPMCRDVADARGPCPCCGSLRLGGMP